jgi:hypothetical protein
MVADGRKSNWWKRTFVESGSLTIAAAAGAAGTLWTEPAAGSALGAGAYLLTKWLEWIKSRDAHFGRAYSHHMAIFQHP